MKKITGIFLAVVGAIALGVIALHRHEPINASWVAARVLAVDPSRATPAERYDNGRDFVPTHKWIAFGHHFAAIAGPGPLVGPTLAAQFGICRAPSGYSSVRCSAGACRT